MNDYNLNIIRKSYQFLYCHFNIHWVGSMMRENKVKIANATEKPRKSTYSFFKRILFHFFKRIFQENSRELFIFQENLTRNNLKNLLVLYGALLVGRQ